MNVKPSLWKSSAYCTVRAFMAAFEILYEGAGMKCMNGARVVEPRVVELYTYQHCNAEGWWEMRTCSPLSSACPSAGEGGMLESSNERP